MDPSPLVAVVVGIAVAWLLLLALFWLLRPRGVPVREVVQVVPDALRLIRGLIADNHVPIDVRVVLVGLLLWFVSPIDLIPEFIPVLGPLDDVVVAIVAMRYVRHRLGLAELRRRWAGSESSFATLARVIA